MYHFLRDFATAGNNRGVIASQISVRDLGFTWDFLGIREIYEIYGIYLEFIGFMRYTGFIRLLMGFIGFTGLFFVLTGTIFAIFRIFAKNFIPYHMLMYS